MGFDLSIMISIYHCSTVQNNVTILKILCALPTHPSLLPNNRQSLILWLHSLFCPFQKCYTVGNHTLYSLIRLTFFPLSNMHFRFFHVFSWHISSFLFNDESYIKFCMYYSLFIYLSTEGHIDSFKQVFLNRGTYSVKSWILKFFMHHLEHIFIFLRNNFINIYQILNYAQDPTEFRYICSWINEFNVGFSLCNVRYL